MNYEIVSKEIAENVYSGIFRKDGKTPYIHHPAAIIGLLKSWGMNDEFANSIAWLHDAIEENKVQINDRITLFEYIKNYIEKNYPEENFNYDDLQKKILDQVDILTFYESDMPKIQMFEKMNFGKKFLKAKYLCEVVENADFNGFIVKVADRICNTREFVKSGSYGYAKKYLTRGEILFCHINYWAQYSVSTGNNERFEVLKKAAKEIESLAIEIR